ncbi:MAG: histidine--tRNA ligase [Myxococcota bacterium]
MRFKALTGFRDFGPRELAFRRWIEETWHQAARGAGFEEFDGPVLEPLELFTVKSGDEIVAQLYAFTDKGDRPVALRPEMTPTLARMIAARAAALPKPIKWYCVQQFFRYERPQRGRGREFFQWNVDVIGAAEPAADAEVMAVAVEALRRLGLGADSLVLRVSDRRFLERMLRSLDAGADEVPQVLASIDKLERDPRAAERLKALLGPERAAELLGWCERMPVERADELEPVLEACRDFGLEAYVQPDFRIVRGLAYYTGPVWELFARGERLRALAGGGRYDGLIATLGGPKLPALGFGMGDVVLGELLRERGLEPAVPPRVDVFVAAIGPEMLAPARRVLQRLRARGVRADAPYGPVKLSRALRHANLSGAGRAVLVGPEEWSQGKVRVKDLRASGEVLVDLEDLE